MSYEQHLPGAAGSIDAARVWIRSIAATSHPQLADHAAQLTGLLVSYALRQTDGGRITIRATPLDAALKVEVLAPGVRREQGEEWADISRLTTKFGSDGDQDDPSLHRTWAILPVPAGVPA